VSPRDNPDEGREGGYIRIIKDDALLERPFLDLEGRLNTQGEGSMNGLAFHPNYADNGLFYVNFVTTEGNVALVEYHVSADPDVADPASERLLLIIDHIAEDDRGGSVVPSPRHFAGMLAFGPNDGFLYISSGDGGYFGDVNGNAQHLGRLLGKILRIDVDGRQGVLPYAIPPSNPFIGVPGAREEIWAYGLRNPWRFSFDPETGDMFIGDVGDHSREEINVIPGTSSGGLNFGWPFREGSSCRVEESACVIEGLIDPLFDYAHFSGGSAAIGGFVYRGSAIPDLQGTYLFADYVQDRWWAFRYENGVIADRHDRTQDLSRPDEDIPWVTSMGRDAVGELYILKQNGNIYRIIPRPTSGLTGDVNDDDFVNAVDVQLVINAALGIALPGWMEPNINGQGQVDAADVQYAINLALGL
jgi:glucose/arabinose dehydrogenase